MERNPAAAANRYEDQKMRYGTNKKFWRKEVQGGVRPLGQRIVREGGRGTQLYENRVKVYSFLWRGTNLMD